MHAGGGGNLWRVGDHGQPECRRQLLGDGEVGRARVEQHHLARQQQCAGTSRQFGLVAAIAGQSFAQRAFLRRRQYGASIDPLAQALRGQLAQVAADRIFGNRIAARQFGGDHAALLPQFLEDLHGALGGEGLGSELMQEVCTFVH